MSQELGEPSKQQGPMRGGTGPSSSRGPAAAGAAGGSSRRTSGSESLMLSPNSAGLGPLTSQAGATGSFLQVGSTASIPEGVAAGPDAAAVATAAAEAAGVGQEGGGGLLAGAAATCSCPCNVVGMGPASAPSYSAHNQIGGAGGGGAAAGGAGGVVSATAEPVAPAAQDEAAEQGLASETGVGTLA